MAVYKSKGIVLRSIRYGGGGQDPGPLHQGRGTGLGYR